MSFNTIALPSPAPGVTSQLVYHRFGPLDGQKVYIQAGLHADETPGLLVAQHLLEHLQTLDAQGRLKAQFILVPLANPVGIRQVVFGRLAGRCDLHTGQNFNRQMSVDKHAVESFVSELTGSAEENDAALRSFLLEQIAGREANFEVLALHKALLSLSIDSHIMIDLHCDDVALPHVFYGAHQKEMGQALAKNMGLPISLEEDVTGTVAFDGTHTQPWVVAQNKGVEFSQPCFAATLELRGLGDVNDNLAIADANNLLAFFVETGLIDAEYKGLQLPDDAMAIGVDQVKMVQATSHGVVTYQCQLGDTVNEGQLLAEIVLVDQAVPARIQVTAPCEGKVISQTGQFYVTPGQTLLMLATAESQLKPGQQLAY